MNIKDSNAYEYVLWCIDEGNNKVGKYIKKQCRAWLDIVEGKDEEAYFDNEDYEIIYELLGQMIHPDLHETLKLVLI